MADIKPEQNIMIIAGEASGDLHGSALLEKLTELMPQTRFTGIGGSRMKAAGFEPLYDVKDMSFLGFAEVIKHLPFLRKVKKRLLEEIKEKDIKHVILVDYPGFNLNFAKKLKKEGINVIYYISPQVWAWARGRVKKIRRVVDKMLVIFPFEEKFYSAEGVDVIYVGHPLVERMASYEFTPREDFLKTAGLDAEKDILLIMPGSRMQEVNKIMPEAAKAAKTLSERHNMQTVIACADHFDEFIFDEWKNEAKVIKGSTYELLRYSKFGIIKSGTSTLEAAYLGLPFAVVYVTSKLTYLIGRSLIKIKNIALANIVAEKNIVEELIQDDVNAANIIKSAERVLASPEAYAKVKKDVEIVRQKLGKTGASTKAAAVVKEFIGSH